MAAAMKIYINTGATPTEADAEATGVVFSREDSATGTTAIPKPTDAGTNYSWYKTFHLECESGGGTTSLSNRKIRMASAPSAGLTLHYKDGADTYAQATSGNKPTDDAAVDDATPTGFTAMTTSFVAWDSASEAAVDATRNGNFVQVVCGVSNLYVGGAGSGVALPNIEMQYDEA